MRNRILTLGILVLLMFSTIIPISFGYNVKISDTIEQPSTLSRGKTLYVGGTGDGNYTKIQDAIDNASDGDTVFVYDRLSPYYELLSIDKPINLIGENRDTTVIDAGKHGTPVTIQSDNVTVSGFTLINPDNEYSSFRYNCITLVGVDNAIIAHNKISIGILEQFHRAIAGIYLKDSSNNLIKDNIIFCSEIQGITYGIELYYGTRNNNASGNEIYGYIAGIEIESEDNTIFDNYIHCNGEGILNRGDRNKIINNFITRNEYQGIINGNAQYTLISGNTITDNGGGGEFHCGIDLGSSNNSVIDNNISNNNPTGILLIGGSEDDCILKQEFHRSIVNEVSVDRWSRRNNP